MTDKQAFVLRNETIIGNALAAVRGAGKDARITVSPPQRSNDQNAMFHAIVGDIVRAKLEWAGKPRKDHEWKVLLVSAHAVATAESEDGRRGEVVPGLEGEFVSLRESTASMSVARASSLIEYTLAFCAMRGVELRDTRRGGFLDLQERAA